MNKQAFIDTAAAILAADRFNLETWASSDALTHTAEDVNAPVKIWDDCNTTACVAGWAVAAKWDKIPKKYISFDGVNWVVAGRTALGITPLQGYRLFYNREGSVWAANAERFGWETRSYCDALEDAKQITAAQAAQVLLEIANGIIVL